jgi:Uri superfamily endonuclease
LQGIYVLIIQIGKPIQLKVGALGNLTFPAGLYAYVGSAQNNLERRVARHLRKQKRLFWHIDYLLSHEAARVVEEYFLAGQKTEECRIAQFIRQSGGEPVKGFGRSDCHCTSHLFYAPDFGFLEQRMQRLNLV